MSAVVHKCPSTQHGRYSQSDNPSSPDRSFKRTCVARRVTDDDKQFSTSGEYHPVSTIPKFKVGIVADIQYAPIPDGYSFVGTPRYYRHSLEAARHAAVHFQEANAELVLNLGDIIDGKCQTIAKNGGEPLPKDTDPGTSAVQDVLDALAPYTKGPIIHTYGNHELYNLDREVIGKMMDIPFVKEPCGELVGYRSVGHRGYRFITIDSYDITMTGRCAKTSQKHKDAVSILERENPNYPGNVNSAKGLEGVNKRFVAFNGAVGKLQFQWLDETLQAAREAQERVIILSHQPILPCATNEICLVWNYDQVLQILRKYSDIVVACFAGHAHSGGYRRDEESGIHFRFVEAVLESPHPHNTYGMLEIHNDCIVFKGFGDCSSGVYDLNHLKPLE